MPCQERRQRSLVAEEAREQLPGELEELHVRCGESS